MAYLIAVIKTIKPLSKRDPLNFKYKDSKDRKMVSIRLPEPLIAKLKTCAEETGYTFTDIVQYALDQYCQIQNKS